MSFSPLVALAITLFCMGAVWALTERVRLFLLRRAMLDIPNERSSHKIPVPRGGGWALIFVLFPVLAAALFLFDAPARSGFLLIGLALLVGVSWLDDRHDVSPLLRLGLHLAAAALGCLALPPDALIFGGALPLWLERLGLVFGWGWFINLYNFMDGIDGITGAESIAIAAGILAIQAIARLADPFVSVTALAIIGGCLGFLRHNWHPARIFLGDVGSVPLGYLLGFGLIFLAVHGYWAAALCLPLYYLADSGITIVKRALKGEKIWQAHRQHFYQRAALGWGRHDRVVYHIVAANAGLIGAAVSAVFYPLPALAVAAVLVAVLLQKLHKASLIHTEAS